MGYDVTNASIVTFDKPYHSVQVEGSEILNNEVTPNYVVVRASANCSITGKPYVHAKNVIYRNNDDVPSNNGENVVTIKNATLVSLANSSSVGARTLAYYGYANTVSQGIYLVAEKPGDMIKFTNPWGKEVTGFIKELDGTMGVKDTYADAVIMSNYTPLTITPSRTLEKIEITTPPDRVNFEAGEIFDPSGMVVTATYDNGDTVIIENYNFSPNRPLTEEDTEITITYTELGVTCSDTVDITVTIVLKQIAVTTPPINTVYASGQVFDPTGMVVTAYYSDGSSNVVDNYTYSPTGELTTDIDSIEITYSEDGVTVNTYQPIAVDSTLKPISITITTPPDKVRYAAGEIFNPEGMICSVVYENTEGEQITNNNVRGYVYSPTGALTSDITKITVSYTYNNTTVSTTQEITVVELTSIAITKQPTKTDYYEDEYFNPLGMEVTAYYSDGSSQVVTNYTYSPNTPLVVGIDTIIVSYTEGQITKTANVAIEVTYFDYDFTKSAVISTNGNFTLQSLGATHKNIRVVCIGGGTGGSGGYAGKNGKDSRDATASHGNYSEQDPGTGGNGGNPGTGGSSGKVFYQDLYIASLTDTLNASLGIGGNGGSGGTISSSSETNPGYGSSGGDTTFTYGSTSISSSQGTNSSTGFTDIFTTTTYALPGTSGKAGKKGGDGGSYNANGNQGESTESNSGGSGGSPTNETGGRCVDYYTDEQTLNSSKTYRAGETLTGYRDYRFDRDSGTYSLQSYFSQTINEYGRNDWAYNYVGSGRNKISYEVPIGYSSPQTTLRGYYNERTAQPEYTDAYYRAYGGGGGGGAAYDSNGGNASTNGGKGADGTNRPTPSVFGNGGDGGNGGGGGGGGGGTYIETHENADSYTASGRSGGLGGTGGKGGNGAQGCIIIYYS